MKESIVLSYRYLPFSKQRPLLKLFQISLNCSVCCTNHHGHFTNCNLRIILNSINQPGCRFTFLLAVSFKKYHGLWRQFFYDIFYDIYIF